MAKRILERVVDLVRPGPDLPKLRTALDDVVARLVELGDRIATAERAVEEVVDDEQRYSVAAVDLQKLRDERDRLAEREDALRAAVDRAERRQSANDLTRTKQELADATADYRNAHKAREVMLARHASEAKDADAKCNMAQSAIALLRQRIAALERNHEQHEQGRADTVRGAMWDTNQRASALRNLLRNQRAAHETAAARLAELQERAAPRGGESRRAADIEQAEAAVEAAGRCVTETEGELAAAMDEHERLESELASLRSGEAEAVCIRGAQ